MKNNMNQSVLKASNISLVPYYVLGLVGTGMGIVVVAVLIFFTPLEPIQDLILGQTMTLNRVMTHYLPRFLLISGLSFFAVVMGINRMLRPISLCLNLLKKGAGPSPEIIEAAKRRLLNLPILVIPVNVLMWVIIPSLVALFTTLAGFLDHRTVITLSARASMVGPHRFRNCSPLYRGHFTEAVDSFFLSPGPVGAIGRGHQNFPVQPHPGHQPPHRPYPGNGAAGHPDDASMGNRDLSCESR